MGSIADKAFAAFTQQFIGQNPGGNISAGVRKGVDTGMDWDQQLKEINTKRGFAKADLGEQRNYDTGLRLQAEDKNTKSAADLLKSLKGQKQLGGYFSGFDENAPPDIETLQKVLGIGGNIETAKEQNKGRADAKPPKYEPEFAEFPMLSTMDAMGRTVKTPDYEGFRASYGLAGSVTKPEMDKLRTMPKGEKRDNELRRLQAKVDAEPMGAPDAPNPDLDLKLAGATPEYLQGLVSKLQGKPADFMTPLGPAGAVLAAAQRKLSQGAPRAEPMVPPMAAPIPRPVTTQTDFNAQRGR